MKLALAYFDRGDQDRASQTLRRAVQINEFKGDGLIPVLVGLGDVAKAREMAGLSADNTEMNLDSVRAYVEAFPKEAQRREWLKIAPKAMKSDQWASFLGVMVRSKSERDVPRLLREKWDDPKVSNDEIAMALGSIFLEARDVEQYQFLKKSIGSFAHERADPRIELSLVRRYSQAEEFERGLVCAAVTN